MFLQITAAAVTLIVPVDHPTIQAALTAAAPGDTVLVQPGTYAENVSFLGKDVILRSVAGPAVTTIDGSDLDTVVLFPGGETGAAVLGGFTITGGKGSRSFLSTSTKGGGISCQAGAAPTIEGNVVEGNSASWGAGLLCVNKSSPLVRDNVFRQNAVVHFGGAIMAETSSPEIRDNHIHDNTSGIPTGSGGAPAIYVAGASSARIEGNLIEDNVAAGSGGAVAINNGFTVVTLVRDNHIRGNVTPFQAGGLWVTRSKPRIEHNVIEGNSAAEGGAMVILDSTVQLEGNVVFGNTASVRGGGLFARLDSTVSMSHDTLYGNVAAQEGGALSLSDSTVDATGAILWGNSAPTGGEAFLTFGSTLKVRYSDVEGGQASVEVEPGNTLNWASVINADPLFADAPNGDLRLLAGSPCEDAGDPLLQPLDLDRWGGLRLVDGDLDGTMVVDIGAHERDNVRLSWTWVGASLHFRVRGPAHFTGYVVASPFESPELHRPFGTLYPQSSTGVILHEAHSLPFEFTWTPGGTASGPLSFQAVGIEPASGLGNYSNPVGIDLTGP